MCMYIKVKSIFIKERFDGKTIDESFRLSRKTVL